MVIVFYTVKLLLSAQGGRCSTRIILHSSDDELKSYTIELRIMQYFTYFTR